MSKSLPAEEWRKVWLEDSQRTYETDERLRGLARQRLEEMLILELEIGRELELQQRDVTQPSDMAAAIDRWAGLCNTQSAALMTRLEAVGGAAPDRASPEPSRPPRERPTGSPNRIGRIV